MVEDDTKLPLFHGNGMNDLDQYQFLCEEVQSVGQSTNDDVKKGQLATTLWDHAVNWQMKFIQVRKGTPTKNLYDVRRGLVGEFQKPKSKA